MSVIRNQKLQYRSREMELSRARNLERAQVGKSVVTVTDE